jgi:6-phosphogluconolactonase
MSHTSATPVLTTFSSDEELRKALTDFILVAQKEAIEKKGRFTIALSGGSLPKQLSELIGRPGVKWDKW